MPWIYRNDGDAAVVWGGQSWGPGEERTSRWPVPMSVGLTRTEMGDGPSPVLCHEDIILQARERATLELGAPAISRSVALSLFCISGGGATVRFNGMSGKELPLDVRGFVHTVPWELCAMMTFENPTDEETHISVSAVEVC